MKFTESGKVKLEKHEPCMRSCWECNNSHEHLKKVNSLHFCFSCGKQWIFDKFLTELGSDEKLIEFLKENGLNAGQSSTKIDKGYRVTQITIKSEKVNK